MRMNRFFNVMVALVMLLMTSCSSFPEQQTSKAITDVMDEFQAVGISAAVVKDGKIVYKIVIDSTGAIVEAERAGEDVGKHFGTGAGRMEDVWTGAAHRIGAAFVDMAAKTAREAAKLLTGSIETGMEFDSAMSQVAATLGYTTEQLRDANSEESKAFQKLRDFARKEGNETVFTATQAAEALNYMALAGYNADTSIAMLPTVLNLAAAGAMDLGRASDVVTDIQSALGLTTEETIEMVDQMAKTAQKTNTSVAQLGEAMLQIGPTAKVMKYGTAEITEVLGILASNGVKGAEGGTHLRNMLLSLSSPTEKGADALEALGISIFDDEGQIKSFLEIMPQLQRALYGSKDAIDEMMKAANATSLEELQKTLDEMSDEDLDRFLNGLTQQDVLGFLDTVFNKRDIASALALINTSEEEWMRLYGLITGSEGAAGEMAKTQLDNLKGDLTKLQSAWNNFQIELADKFAPVLREIMPQLIELVNHLTENLADADWSGLGDVILGIAEKLVTFLEYIINNGDQVVHTAEGIAAAFLGLKGFSFGKKGIGGILGGLFGGGNGAAAAETAASAAASGAGMAAAGTAAALALPGSLLGAFGFAIKDYVSARNEAIEAATMDSSASLEELKANLDEQNKILEEAQKFYDERYEKEYWQSMSGIEPEDGQYLLSKAQAELDAAEAALKVAEEQYNAALEAAETAAGETESSTAETLGGLADQASGWGSDMMIELANGITEGASSWVIPAVVGVASMISSYLHHSEPDIGPLSNDSEWMPDMIRGFASQIEQYGPLITGALEKSLDISGIPTRGDIERSLSVNIAAMGAASRQAIEVPVNLDGREIARATAWSMSEQMAWEEM